MSLLEEFVWVVRWPLAVAVGAAGALRFGMWIGTWPEWAATVAVITLGFVGWLALFVLAEELQRPRRKPRR